jgi:putative regulatory protein
VATEVSICNYIDMEKNEILKIFGKNLRAERNRAGYSQDELAEKMGICAGKHIGTIERGETNPSLITIIAVMQALDISFDKLFEIKNQ